MIEHFFVADLHLGHHAIIRHCRRYDFLSKKRAIELESNPDRFRATDEEVAFMNSALISTINKMVAPSDVLWFLGDLFYTSGSTARYAKFVLDQIRCKNIHMVFGNHDSRRIGHYFATAEELQYCSICPITGEYRIGWDSVNKRKSTRESWAYFSLCHTAQLIWPNNHRKWINLYGHSHTNAEAWCDKNLPGRRQIDVGIDNAKRIFGEYRPFTLKDVLDLLETKSGFCVDFLR